MSLRLLLLLEYFPSLLNLIMSRESRLCPGMRGRKCGAFLSLLDRDPYPTCTRCRGKSCTKDLTCDFCIGWSSSQWEAFAKTQTYKERKLSRPSGFLPPATKTSPRAGTSSEVLHPEASSSSRDAPCAASREAFSTPARPRCSERVGSVSGRSSVHASLPLSLLLLRELKREELPPADAVSSVASPRSSLHALRRGESGESSMVCSRSRSSRVS